MPYTSVKKLKGEVRMAVPKGAQTRMVGIIKYMTHPFACFLIMLHVYWYMCSTILMPCRDTLHSLPTAYLLALLATRCSEWRKGGGVLVDISLVTWNASVGMHHVCDYSYHSCLSTFWHRHPCFILQLFFTLVTIIFSLYPWDLFLWKLLFEILFPGAGHIWYSILFLGSWTKFLHK